MEVAEQQSIFRGSPLLVTGRVPAERLSPNRQFCLVLNVLNQGLRAHAVPPHASRRAPPRVPREHRVMSAKAELAARSPLLTEPLTRGNQLKLRQSLSMMTTRKSQLCLRPKHRPFYLLLHCPLLRQSRPLIAKCHRPRPRQSPKSRFHSENAKLGVASQVPMLITTSGMKAVALRSPPPLKTLNEFMGHLPNTELRNFMVQYRDEGHPWRGGI